MKAEIFTRFTRSDLFWIRRAGTHAGVAILLLGAYRLAFTWAFYSGEANLPVARALLQGLRFDLATLSLLIGPVLMLEPFGSLFVTRLSSAVVWRRIVSGAHLLWIFLGCCLLGSGLLQYYFNHKLPGPEFFVYIKDGLSLGSAVAWNDPLLFFACLAPGVPALALALRLVRKAPRSEPPRTASSLIASRIVVLCSLVVLLRGGLQESPLRPADALHATSTYLGNLPLNAVFTLYHAASESGDFPVFFDPAHNVRFVRELYRIPASANENKNEKDPNTAYPLLREMPGRTHPVFAGNPAATDSSAVYRPHIVVILLESFSSVFLAEHGGDPRLVPELNRLTERGVYFPRFFSAGGRSANALFSLLTGIPDRAGRTILRSPAIQNRFGSLPRLLTPGGYRSIFVHGGDLSFDSLDGILPHFGFDRLLGPGHMEGGGFDSGPAAPPGHDDGVLYRTSLDALDEYTAKGPVFALLFTLSTHHPYHQGPDAHRIDSGATPDGRLRNSIRFADRALGDFLTRARNRPWFRDTIFVLAADHSHHAGLSFLDDLHLPLVFFAPVLLKPERRSRTATHLDLLPTLFAFSGGGGRFAAFGRDLFARDDPVRGAFFAGGSRTDVIGWIEDERLCYVWPRIGRAALYSSAFPVDAFQRNFVEPQRLARCADRARHVYQLARDLERRNRIWPPAEK